MWLYCTLISMHVCMYVHVYMYVCKNIHVHTEIHFLCHEPFRATVLIVLCMLVLKSPGPLGMANRAPVD